MALFPTSPTNGELANVGNITYQYNSTIGAWNRVGTTVTPILDGDTVSISGNLAVTGTGVHTFSGNIQADNLNVISDLEAFTVRAPTVYVDTVDVNLPGNLTVTPYTVFADGAEVTLDFYTIGNIYGLGNAQINQDLAVIQNITAQTVQTTGNITASTGNIQGDYILGNGAFLSGVITSVANINNGTSTVAIDEANGNVHIDIDGSSNIAVFTTSGVAVTGNVDATRIRTDNYQYANGTPLQGTASRVSLTAYTGNIAANATANVNISGYKGYALYRVQTLTENSWVRIYTSTSARTSDASRTIGTDPLSSAGVIAEVIAVTANTYVFAPGVIGFNDEGTPNNNIALAVTNTGAAIANIGVTLTVLQLEA